MSNWNKDNFAAWGTYRAFAHHQELDPILVSFEQAETLKMPGLSFYVLGANSDELDSRADIVAMQLYQFHLVNYRPQWEDPSNIDSTRKALNSIKAKLVDKEASVADLSNSIDSIFEYANE